ncbi:ArsR/SmtB family transcription factor [Aestuariibius sp. HNIBRBA575]|uniref:ArsR/SmtB family transcription factor n=1 Tax=Aestuariibius sp. HNIBRBA575 TaxID=3233343 RepID=UPI0034A55900
MFWSRPKCQGLTFVGVVRDHLDMKEGPDITRIGAMIGDPTRANMLMALMSGRALTAGELAEASGVTAPTASGHLKQMVDAGLLWPRAQGRHRYYVLADDDVGHALEALMGLAAAKGHLRTRTGPKDPQLRAARMCYDHLAGAAGVQMFDALAAKNVLGGARDDIAVTAIGDQWITDFGMDANRLRQAKRPLCRTCLDWSERRSHLAGAFGAALVDRMFDLGWITREENSRVIRFSKTGQAAFNAAFPA